MTLTTTQLLQRLRRLEAEILPPPRVPFVILRMPADGAGPEEWTAYAAELDAARQARAKVCVITDRRPIDLEARDGVTYVNHMWEAELHQLANAPSDHGRPNALHDLFALLRRSARVVNPDPGAAQPDGDEDDEGGPVVPCARIFEAQPQSRLERRWTN